MTEHDGTQGSAKKSEQAFRTISEVADELGLQQHVLRFWETKFPQIKPLKRGGGRRYYRPEDIKLLIRIRDLLHNDGYTIKGVQKLLKRRDPAPNEMEPVDEAVTPEMAPGKPLLVSSAARDVPPSDSASLSPGQTADLQGVLRELRLIRDLIP